MNTIRGKGHVKDSIDNRDLRIGDLIVAVNAQAEALPVVQWGPEAPSVNLMQWVHEMKDQGQTNACVGFAISRATHMRGLIQGHADMEAPSEYAIWALARAREKTIVEPLQNIGCQPRNACDMASRWGLAPATAWPADASTMNVMPTPEVLSSASRYRLSDYYEIDGTDRSTNVRQALTAGVPVCAAFQVDRTFNEFTGSYVMPNFDGSMLGGHYVTIIGYSGNSYLICNSWGTTWGFGGFAWISEERLLHPTTTDLRAALVVPFIEEGS